MCRDIYAMAPINKTAALVTQKASKNNTYEPKNKGKLLNVTYWENPKPMVNIPENYTDFTLTKFGRMTVLGYLGSSKWQCKCQCGKYFSRKTKVLSRGISRDEELCHECHQFTRIKKREHFRKTGKYTSDDYDWFN